MVTLPELITTVRDLIFDRFIIPGLAIKGIAGHTITVSNTSIVIKNSVSATIYTADLTVLTTVELLTANLLSSGIVFSYTPYYNSSEKTTSLMPVTDIAITADYTVFKKYFFSDERIVKEILYYYYRVLNGNIASQAILESILPKLVYPSERHLCYWVAFKLLEERRSYEAAAQFIGQSFTDGSGYNNSGSLNNGDSITTQIGSVFTIVEDPKDGYFYEDFNRVGSDNFWGDKYSFWYRLMLSIRSKIEEEFGDYSLRPDEVMVSTSSLDKPLNLRSYFDSYPFTMSPLTRGIISP